MIKYLTPQAQGSIPTIQPAVHGGVIFAWLRENWAQGPGTNVDTLAVASDASNKVLHPLPLTRVLRHLSTLMKGCWGDL